MNEDDYPEWLDKPAPKEDAERIMNEYLSYMMGVDPE